MINLTIIKIVPDENTIIVSVQNSFDKSIEEVSFSSGTTSSQITEAIQDKCDQLNTESDLDALIGTIFVSKKDK